MHAVKLLNLNCHVSDESDLDEIYLKFNKEKIWPESSKFQRLQLGSTALNLTISEGNKGDVLEIEIWDHDMISRDDLLGTFTLHLDEFGGGFQTEMKKVSGTKASYSIDWEFY